MKYKFKKGIKFINHKKEFAYAIATKEMPSFIGGLSLKIDENDNLNYFLDLIKADKDFKYLSLANISQNDFNNIITSVKDKIVELEYSDYNNQDLTLDLKCLKLCKKLKKVKINYGEKNIKLWNTRFNHKLEELELIGCKQLFNQKGLIGLNAKKLVIKRYSHGAPYAKQLIIKDFSVFETMKRLEKLHLFIKNKKEKTKDLISLSKLKNLKEIQLPKNYFFFSQYAWLTSKLPNVTGLGCYRIEYDHANEMDGYIINGSRMCWYIRGFEKNKLKKYINKFNILKENYITQELPPVK